MPRLSKIGAAALAAFGWTTGAPAVTASYLVLAGGAGAGGQETTAGGGGWSGGGGGAGGLVIGTTSLNLLLSYAIVVGAGGAGGSSSASPTNGSIGNNSTFNSITANAGGGGGAGGGNVSGAAGLSGGSGGGGGSGFTGAGAAGGAATQTSPTGGTGYGNAGGTCPANSTGGGGGGAGGAGGVPTRGIGLANSITGTSVTYAVGGLGQYNASNTAGTANSGNGGDNGTSINVNSLAGGSGVVIISYLGVQQFGGGVVTSVGGNTIHTFNTSGTLSPLSLLSASALIVAGGGSGGAWEGGGGGAGGLQSITGQTIDTNSTYVITVGAGASAKTSNGQGINGSNSSFSVYATTSVGGGGGGAYTGSSSTDGSAGGSGGGGGAGSGGVGGNGGAATSGQGYAGGQGQNNDTGAGGGGAGGLGQNGTGTVGGAGGAGGVGLANPITGSSAGQLVGATYYLAGGGGGCSNGSGGAGGNGGGGVGNGGSATANTGGGGGGSRSSGSTSGAGGSGIVIISYAGSTQSMAGGTVTISGGNVIHTFTSSGYLTPITLINKSLRFRSSASAYLNRTPVTATNRRTYTWSGWVKRGALSYGEATLFNAGTTGIGTNDTGFLGIRFTSGDKLDITTGATDLRLTTQVFRDPAAWYHIVVAFDTTQTTGANRVKIYVNGTQVTAYAGTDPSLNLDTAINNTNVHEIGRTSWNAAGYFDGYMAEVNFIDGLQLTPNSFGTFNSYGVWQPITYGGSYGTNGFYLPFTNTTSTTTLGYDFSPQGNNFTVNNISLTTGSTYDSMTDVPTLTSATVANYCVLNPLLSLNSTASDGNLKSTLNAASVTTIMQGTLAGGSTGKFYWESTYVSRSGNSALTIGGVRSDVFNGDPSGTGGFGYYSVGGQVFVNGSTVATYATYTTTDVIGIALDLTNSQVSFYKQTSGTGSFVLQGTVSIASNYFWIPGYANGTSSGNQVFTANFGQQPFNNSSPPTGFVALNTYNM